VVNCGMISRILCGIRFFGISLGVLSVFYCSLLMEMVNLVIFSLWLAISDLVTDLRRQHLLIIFML